MADIVNGPVKNIQPAASVEKTATKQAVSFPPPNKEINAAVNSTGTGPATAATLAAEGLPIFGLGVATPRTTLASNRSVAPKQDQKPFRESIVAEAAGHREQLIKNC